MTDDKHFKHRVREEARRTGRRYTEVRGELRPSAAPDPGPVSGADAGRAGAERFRSIVEVIESWVYGQPEVVELAALGLVAQGTLLLRGGTGHGMMALAKGVAAAIGGEVVAVDGRTGLSPESVAGWGPGDVVVISHLDGLSPADQVAVVEARERPALLLAKVHPVAGRMPHPPDDDVRERFTFGAALRSLDGETELRIVNEVRDGTAAPVRRAAVDAVGLAALRTAVAAVDVPEEVRRHAVAVVDATRHDPAVLVGASPVATMDLVRAAAARAGAAGRAVATVDDVDALREAVLGHRLVPVG